MLGQQLLQYSHVWEVSNTAGTDGESFTGSSPYVAGLITLVLADGLWSKPLWGLFLVAEELLARGQCSWRAL